MGTHGHAAAPPPPPPPPKVPFVRRYKFVWPILLAVNLGVGGNFSLTKKSFLFRLNVLTLVDHVGNYEMGFPSLDWIWLFP